MAGAGSLVEDDRRPAGGRAAGQRQRHDLPGARLAREQTADGRGGILRGAVRRRGIGRGRRSAALSDVRPNGPHRPHRLARDRRRCRPRGAGALGEAPRARGEPARVRHLRAAVVGVPARGRDAAAARRAVDPELGDPLRRGRGRDLALPDPAHDLPNAALDPGELHLHHDARAGVLRAPAGAHLRDDRRVRGARSVPVLRHVGRDAHPDVFHHRGVGGQNRLYAALKFFVYTFFGSLLMLVAILALVYLVAQRTGVYSFSYFHLMGNVGELGTLAFWLFGAFFLAFAIKVPIFPFHTWLPDAHVEAPTAGSVILAAVLLKMGTYGFLRFALPLFPQAALHPAVQTAIVTLSLIGILYGGLVAMVQPDFKKLIAYSSVAHLGFVTLGIWALTLQSVQGALMVMINHGISTGALFFLVGMLYERRHTRLIEAFGGIAKVVPLFAAVLTIVSLSSIRLPSTNGFVGEFLVLIGAFQTYPVAATIAAAGVIVAAMYLLPALPRVIYNPLDKRENERLLDLSPRELAVLLPLVACIVWIGVYPKPLLRRMEPSAQQLIQTVRAASATVARGR